MPPIFLNSTQKFHVTQGTTGHHKHYLFIEDSFCTSFASVALLIVVTAYHHTLLYFLHKCACRPIVQSAPSIMLSLSLSLSFSPWRSCRQEGHLLTPRL